jgi:hypothetical protein
MGQMLKKQRFARMTTRAVIAKILIDPNFSDSDASNAVDDTQYYQVCRNTCCYQVTLTGCSRHVDEISIQGNGYARVGRY